VARMLVMVFGGGLDSVCGGVKVWLDNCYVGTIWLYVFFFYGFLVDG